MSEGIWYYAQEGRRNGPVSLEELRSLARSGGLKAEDLVWSSGMESWTSAASVPGLLPAALPPLPVRAAASASRARRFPWKLAAVAAIVAVAVLGAFLWRRLYSPSIDRLLAVVPRDAQALVVVRGLPQLALDLGLFKGRGGAVIAAFSDLVGLAAMELSDEASLLGTGLDVTAPLGMSVHRLEGQEVEVYYLPVADRERLRAALGRFAESKGWSLESATLAGTTLESADDGRFGFVEHRGHLVTAYARGAGKIAPFLEKLAGAEAGSVAEAGWLSSMGPLTDGRWHVLALVDPVALRDRDLKLADFEDPWSARLPDLAGLGARLEISSDAIRLRYQEVSREGVDHALSRFVGSREDRFASQIAGEALGFVRLSIDLARLAEDPPEQGSGNVGEYLGAFKSSLGGDDPTAYLGSPLSVAVLKTEPGGELPVDVVAWMPIKPGHDLKAELDELAQSMGRDGMPVSTEQRDGVTWYALEGQLSLAWAVVRDHLVVALRSPRQKVLTADSGESFVASLRREELRGQLLSQHDMAVYVDLKALAGTFREELDKELADPTRIYLDSVGGLAAWVDSRPRELVSEWTLYPRQSGGFGELVASLESQDEVPE